MEQFTTVMNKEPKYPSVSVFLVKEKIYIKSQVLISLYHFSYLTLMFLLLGGLILSTYLINLVGFLNYFL